jgi:uncharacterized membrane protein required for colicin V production
MASKKSEEIAYFIIKTVLILFQFFLWFFLVGLISKAAGAVVGLIGGLLLLAFMNYKRNPKTNARMQTSYLRGNLQTAKEGTEKIQSNPVHTSENCGCIYCKSQTFQDKKDKQKENY